MFDTFQSGMDEKVIAIENICVHYKVPTERVRSLKEYSIRFFQGKIENKKFEALKDVSLEIYRGEILGIMGKNGAGKSTLMKVISRVLTPTSGHLWIKGEVSPLLQLSAGFHPELTGKENVFLNGTLLGYKTSQIQEKINEIIAFSEIGDFINAPVRTYSTGMQARLAFSVATAWEPEILILDEVLSVGDVGFQKKCYQRMESFRKNGATVILVSHSPKTVAEICQRVAWLHNGQIREIGSAEQITAAYESQMIGH